MTNSFIIKGDTAEIELHAPYGRRVTTVIDLADLPKVSSYPGKWRALDTRKTGKYYGYADIKLPEAKASKSRKYSLQMLHRFILDAPPKKAVDHANHDTLDNRRCNIRPVDPFLNSLNREKPNKPIKYGDQYTAQINVKGKPCRLGMFASSREAEIAMVAARIAILHVAKIGL